MGFPFLPLQPPLLLFLFGALGWLLKCPGSHWGSLLGSDEAVGGGLELDSEGGLPI